MVAACLVCLSSGSFSLDAQDNPFSLSVSGTQESESESDRAVRLFNEGKFSEAIDLAAKIDKSLGKYSVVETWQILIIRAYLVQGQYDEARKSVEAALERFEYSIRIRWLGHQAYRFCNDTDQSDKMLAEIGQLASKSSWRFRDLNNLLQLGRYFLDQGVDAKTVLDTFYYPLRKKIPDNPEVHRAIGDLAFEKHDYGLAAESYQKVVKVLPRDPDALCQLGLAFAKSDSERANKAINQALAINPNHINCLLKIADQQISSENYAEAKAILEKVRAVNPNHPKMWSYRALLAHLDNQPKQEGEFRERGLSCWKGNPEVDHIIGRELSEKYRFEEGAKYQRRSLVYDDEFLPAKIQLAHDLLRLGQELEGWKLADEVFDADQYSVVALNLVTLRDNMSKFRTLQKAGFVVRMDAEEAEIYGDRVLNLLVDAKDKLCKKYEVELELPVFVEIFPKQQDFAIRTFGLPGGDGFLGVCFGRVITMNSPAAQGANLTSWESVLWHEFCHVVTLQKTKNKMPRWLSEGISVYEEELADPAWGDEMSIEYREMVLGEDLTPVSQLSGAFMRPPTPAHLQFAYYESSLVVEYLVEEYGLESLVNVLNELSIGTPINDALRRHVAPVDFLDKKFAEFAKERANALAKDANWDTLDEKPVPDSKYWAAWNKEHPDNVKGLINYGAQLAKEKAWVKAITPLERVVELSPKIKLPYPVLARCYRETGQPEKAIKTLEAYAKLDANSVDVFLSLLEATSKSGDWGKTRQYARKLAALNPLLVSPHKYLARAAEELGNDDEAIKALTVLAKLDPFDPADVYFRLASAYSREKQLTNAKRQVIKALEQAPRYREAHALLLKILDDQDRQSELEETDDKPAVEKDGASR